MAITRSNGEKIDYPEPDTAIQKGDTFLMVGETDELATFNKLAKGETPPLPKDTDSSLWVVVPENSVVAGKTLAELTFEQQFGTIVQAIRRKGKYIRFPDGNNAIQASDKLLLFGNLALLADIGQKIAVKENPVLLG
jgi:CPA2 family monovalent cation:H+ antiporter-2